MNWKKHNKREEFYYKNSYLEHRLQKDVMEDGIAYIPCRVEGIGDIISRFSIKGCESLDGEFMDYLLDFVDCIPDEYPVVLEIHGPKFTDEVLVDGSGYHRVRNLTCPDQKTDY